MWGPQSQLPTLGAALRAPFLLQVEKGLWGSTRKVLSGVQSGEGQGHSAKAEDGAHMAAPLTSLKAGKHAEETMRDQMKEAEVPACSLSPSAERKASPFTSTPASMDTAPTPRCHHRRSPQVILRTLRLRHSRAQVSSTPGLP